jgi:hypothetical protein
MESEGLELTYHEDWRAEGAAYEGSLKTEEMTGKFLGCCRDAGDLFSSRAPSNPSPQAELTNYNNGFLFKFAWSLHYSCTEKGGAAGCRSPPQAISSTFRSLWRRICGISERERDHNLFWFKPSRRRFSASAKLMTDQMAFMYCDHESDKERKERKDGVHARLP